MWMSEGRMFQAEGTARARAVNRSVSDARNSEEISEATGRAVGGLGGGGVLEGHWKDLFLFPLRWEASVSLVLLGIDRRGEELKQRRQSS